MLAVLNVYFAKDTGIHFILNGASEIRTYEGDLLNRSAATMTWLQVLTLYFLSYLQYGYMYIFGYVYIHFVYICDLTCKGKDKYVHFLLVCTLIALLTCAHVHVDIF